MRFRVVTAMLMVMVLAASGCKKEAPAQQDSLVQPPPVLQVKSVHGNVEGLAAIDEFVQGAAKGQTIAVQVTHYTIEGDPIYYIVHYDGQGSYQIRYDTTEDKFGSGEVKTYSCGNFVKTETEVSMAYTAEICTGGRERVAVLDIGYDVSAEDRFEFVLQYGAGGEKTLRSAELSKQQLQQIYKEFVLANYLFAKDLSTACKQASDERYKLSVWINSATEQYEWASCDSSTHGQAMTAAVKHLLAMKQDE